MTLFNFKDEAQSDDRTDVCMLNLGIIWKTAAVFERHSENDN